jgi:PPP family 3-phenylpropionic acid transporter
MRRSLPLAAYWFFYFGALGIFFPFYSLYLHENAGLSGAKVGVVLAMLPVVGLVAQPLWGWVADRTGARSAVLTALTLGAAGGYAVLGVASGFVLLLLATALLAFFSTAVVPVSVSVALAALRDRGAHAFGYVRVWGTLGYLVLVVTFPLGLHGLQELRGWESTAGVSEPGLGLMFVVTAGLAAAAALVGPFLPRDQAVGLVAPRGDWKLLFLEKPVRRLLLFALLAYGCLQGPMALFPVYVRAHGGDIDTVGRMWVLMLLVEIPLVALAGAGVQRLGPRGLLTVGVASGGARWLVCGLTGDLRVIYPMQLLHGVVVTGLLLGGPLYLEAVVPERLRSTGQALLATLGVGCGGMISNLVSGWFLQYEGANAPYLLGGVGAIALSAATGWILPEPRREESSHRGAEEQSSRSTS